MRLSQGDSRIVSLHCRTAAISASALGSNMSVMTGRIHPYAAKFGD